MKKIAFTFIMSLICCIANAQDLFVYSTIGTAEIYKNGKWAKLEKRNGLTVKDIIRIGKNSALSILDKKAEKIYSIPESEAKSVGKSIESVKDKQQAVSAQFIQHAMKSMFNGESDKISHEAAGCTYRGDDTEHDIFRSIQTKLNGDSLSQIKNEQTDYSISFEIRNRETQEIITNDVKLGIQAFFRIKNNSNKPMYVNVLNIDSFGKRYVCLPMDDAQTMSHLLIPANCTIDLTDYPMEFTEPRGMNYMILIAAENPFDLRSISSGFSKTTEKGVLSSYPLGIYKIQTKIL
ncbi:MAG: hypothetical protein WCU80_05370 [Paludibacteraceae bacterium]|nr:hypothetical protein [Prevotellaceae bacterium]